MSKTPPPTGEEFHETQARHTRQCLREARWTAGVWLAGLIYCGFAFQSWGYIPVESRPATPSMVWGVPAWAFWGLLAPWLVLIAATWWFALFILKDDEPFQKFPAADERSGKASDDAVNERAT